jgi:hypothetical protein
MIFKVFLVFTGWFCIGVEVEIIVGADVATFSEFQVFIH